MPEPSRKKPRTMMFHNCPLEPPSALTSKRKSPQSIKLYELFSVIAADAAAPGDDFTLLPSEYKQIDPKVIA